MNKTMQNMMKPIPVTTNTRAELRRRQEEHILNWLKTYPQSVTRHDVRDNCPDIPGITDNNVPRWATNPYYQGKQCSNVLQRLERKGHIISTLCGSYRYYSIPVENGGDK